MSSCRHFAVFFAAIVLTTTLLRTGTGGVAAAQDPVGSGIGAASPGATAQTSDEKGAARRKASGEGKEDGAGWVGSVDGAGAREVAPTGAGAASGTPAARAAERIVGRSWRAFVQRGGGGGGAVAHADGGTVIDWIGIEPGRHRPTIAPPGAGVPVEAVVTWSGPDGAAPLAEDVRVFAHVRPHPSLTWETVQMALVPGTTGRYQAVLPCAPCLARPEYWLQVAMEASDPVHGEMIEAWWPPAGPSMPAIYDVGYEHRHDGVPGFVLALSGGDGSDAGEPGGPVVNTAPATPSQWRGPAWSVKDLQSPVVALTWQLDAPPETEATLVVALRPEPSEPWTVVERLSHPRHHPMTLAIPVQDHLEGAASVQMLVRLEGAPGAVARIADPRLLDIGCTPPVSPDLDGDGIVGMGDLLLVITALGPCTVGDDCPPDLNGDGLIDLADTLAILAAWEPPSAA